MRRGKSNRSCLHTHPPQGVCWNLPYLVIPRCFLEISQLEGYKVSRKGKMAAQTWQITGFFSLLLRLAALSSEKNKSNVSATCLLSCKLSWRKRGFTNHRQVNKNLIHRKKKRICTKCSTKRYRKLLKNANVSKISTQNTNTSEHLRTLPY